eukprot:15482563-Alexandrium_andersonii.AAC.1
MSLRPTRARGRASASRRTWVSSSDGEAADRARPAVQAFLQLSRRRSSASDRLLAGAPSALCAVST